MSYHTIHTTASGVEILVYNGNKSDFDFIVKYREPGKRIRTPKHIHLIIDLYLKKCQNETLTMRLVDHFINIINSVNPSQEYPPRLQIFSVSEIEEFIGLNDYGEYEIEFILITFELIMIQEKTNYPNGTMNLKLFQKFRNNEDIFSIVNAATFR